MPASERPWDAKPMTQWTEEDAKQVLTDSPWAKPATLEFDNKPGSVQRGRRAGGMGRGGGGIGLGIPGVGIGMGGPRRGGRSRGGEPPNQDGERGHGQEQSNDTSAREVIVRWESALPVQQAELKTKNADAPSIDEKHYAIIVSGLPARLARDSQATESHLKSQAELKRDGKKFSKPSAVRILSRDEGVMVVYLFPRSKEIRSNDTQLEFASKLGRWSVKQTFNPTEMTCQGKLEL